ncbi:peptidoglycan-binding protein [Actinomadura sp. ATCC 39365]
MEVNGRPVFVFAGRVPMHRGIVPGAEGDDVRQVQKALRRLGHRVPVTGVFDGATVAAVSRFYARRGYEAQQPTLELRQRRDELARSVRTAREVLATESRALDQGMDVLPLKLRVTGARRDLKAAEQALKSARAQDRTAEDAAAAEAAESSVRAAEERLLAAEQELAQARATPTVTPSTALSAAPTATPRADTRLLELRVANARADLAAARSALDRAREEAGAARAKRLAEREKAVRVAREAVAVAEQALRQARQLSPARLKVANARSDLAAARALLAEFSRTYGTTVPPGEIVFLPRLPVRLHKPAVKAGEPVDKAVATVTGSGFVVSGSVDAAEAERVKAGLAASIETDSGTTVPGTVTAVAGRDAKGAVPVTVTPAAVKGLRELAGAPVTVRVTIGATGGEVLVVPVAAVVTAADGRARVRVETAPGRTEEVQVRTGLSADGAVEVTGDLEPGERVVVNSG